MTTTTHELLETRLLSGRERYQLLTTLVVPRPIGWISTYDANGQRNLAPFSYFAALAATPMLVGVSVGHRPQGPKDTLTNIRSSRAFCVNIVTPSQLHAMNATSADVPPDVDEFLTCGLIPAEADHVYAPYVVDCPAVLECHLTKEVDLEGAPNTLLIGEVMAVRLSGELQYEEGTRFIRPDSLRAVGRLGSQDYLMPGDVYRLPRPRVGERGEGGG